MDVALFVVLLLAYLKQGASSSGGREMGLFFAVLVPSIILVAAMALFVFSGSNTGRLVALFIVAGPGLFIGGAFARSALIDYRVTQNRLGRGYFSGATMKAMGAAVVRGDIAEIQRLGATVDVNHVADTRDRAGMTFMRLAAENAFRKDSDKSGAEDLAVIKTLLQLGAKPDSGLDAALRIKDAVILALLLDAGADPNLRYNGEQPIVFRWLTVLSVAGFQQLARHGLNVNSFERDEPLCVVALFADRWDLVSLLNDLGADYRKPDDSGRTVAGEVEKRITEAVNEGRAPDPFALEVRAKLQRLAPPAGLSPAVRPK